MAARPSLFAHGEEPVHRPRHRATEKQQVPLSVHSHDAEPQLGEVARAHVPGHALPLDDARRIGTRRDRAGLAVPRIAVGFGTAAEVMAVHHALEAPTLRYARDLDAVAGGENRDRHRFPRLGSLAGNRKTLEHPRHDLEPGLLHVTRQRLRGPRRLLRAEAQLDLRLAHLHHGARTRFDDGHVHVRGFGGEHAGHAEFPTDEAGHWTLISPSTPAGTSSLVRASIVWDRVSRISISRLCVLSSNCSRLFLSMCGLLSTVHSCRLVGSGMGPETCAPVFSAVRTMSAAALSIRAWSNAFSRMRILPAIGAPSSVVRHPSSVAPWCYGGRITDNG